MNKEDLLKLGLTEEQAEKVLSVLVLFYIEVVHIENKNRAG